MFCVYLILFVNKLELDPFRRYVIIIFADKLLKYLKLFVCFCVVTYFLSTMFGSCVELIVLAKIMYQFLI